MKGNLKQIFLHKKAVALCLMFLFASLYLASGLFSVKPEQRGVVTRFGRVVNENVLPGVHYHWPWPIESVVLLRTTEIRSMAVLFGTDKGAEEGKAFSGAGL